MTKSTRPLRRAVRAKVPHGVRSEIVVSIYPDGTIGLRELRRPGRTEQRLDVGQLYVGAVSAAVARMTRRVVALRRAGFSLADARRQARREASL